MKLSKMNTYADYRYLEKVWQYHSGLWMQSVVVIMR